MSAGRRIAGAILALTAMLTYGCDYTYRTFPQTRAVMPEVRKLEREAFPPPPTSIYHETATHHSHTARHQRIAVAKAPEPQTIEPQPAKPTPAPAAPPAITMADDSRSLDKLHAETMLAQTKARFAGIDRGALNSSDTAIYDQAGRFLSAASQALRDDHYSEASGFATKASLLTERLPDTRSER